MKRVILLIVVITTFLSGSAQTGTDSGGEAVYHKYLAVAQIQVGVEYQETFGSFGVGFIASSISHQGRFHVGANANFAIIAGLINNGVCSIDFGPSGRIDISKRVFVNIPVNAVCCVILPQKNTNDNTETSWGARIAPSLYVFLSKRFGLFIGPKVHFGFSDDSTASFGAQFGLSFSL